MGEQRCVEKDEECGSKVEGARGRIEGNGMKKAK